MKIPREMVMFHRKRSRFMVRFGVLVALLGSLLGVSPVRPATASTIIVTNSNDSGLGSLRQAIANAVDGDTITFDSGLSGETIHLTSTLTLSQDITIDGSALESQITISGDDLYRVLSINSDATVSLKSLIIAHGKSPSASSGAGVFNAGSLTLQECTLTLNTSSYDGGGIYNADGTLVLNNSIVENNHAYHLGAGIYNHYGDITISNSSVSYNGNTSSSAGGVYSDAGTLTINDSTFSHNSSANSGGGIFQSGGGILTIVRSVFSDNTASDYAGAILNESMMTITGSTFSGNSAEDVGAIQNNGPTGIAVVADSTFLGNSGELSSGAISNESTMNISNTIFSGNSATGKPDVSSYGGAISNYGTLTITESTLLENSATYGGGIYNSGEDTNIGELTVLDTIFKDNLASRGAGMFNRYSHPDLTNVTFYGNSAGQSGGGVYNDYDSDPTMINVTFSHNTAVAGGGIYNWAQSNPILTNVLIAHSGSGGDCVGQPLSLASRSNLIADSVNSCGLVDGVNGHIVGSDPILGALADNGGVTPTMALLVGSPAIDAGNDLKCPTLDQRGATRPQGSHCDIGAYEFEQEETISLSFALEDGWILESSETSGLGGTKNNTATTLRVGDDAANRQYRSILYFDTPALPEGAVITSVTLKFKDAGKTGTLPFGATHGNLFADICEGTFKNNSALQLIDFNVRCPVGLYKAKALIYTSTSKVGDWYTHTLLPADFGLINLGGVTQFRLRFAKDDNNDFGADFLKLFSGNAVEADRPQLIIEYYVP